MTNKEQAILQCAINIYGVDAQIDIAVEECSELIKALMKFRRGSGEETTAHDVCEEIADVEIMVDQLQLVFDSEYVDFVREEKIKRLERRLELNAATSQRVRAY